MNLYKKTIRILLIQSFVIYLAISFGKTYAQLDLLEELSSITPDENIVSSDLDDDFNLNQDISDSSWFKESYFINDTVLFIPNTTNILKIHPSFLLYRNRSILNIKNTVKLGYTIERDSEEIDIVDTYKLFFYLNIPYIRSEIWIGAFNLHLGQGILFSTRYSLYPSLSQVHRITHNYYPRASLDTSFKEHFLQGIALKHTFRYFSVLLFGGFYLQDGEIEEYSNDFFKKTVITQIENNPFRHNKELNSQKRIVKERLIGFSVDSHWNSHQLSLSFLFSKWNQPLLLETQLNEKDNTFDTSRFYSGISISYQIKQPSWNFFTDGVLLIKDLYQFSLIEVISLKPKTIFVPSIIIGGEYKKYKSFKLSFLYHRYHERLPLSHIGSFSYFYDNKNEEGIYLAHTLYLHKDHSLSGYINTYRRIKDTENTSGTWEYKISQRWHYQKSFYKNDLIWLFKPNENLVDSDPYQHNIKWLFSFKRKFDNNLTYHFKITHKFIFDTISSFSPSSFENRLKNISIGNFNQLNLTINWNSKVSWTGIISSFYLHKNQNRLGIVYYGELYSSPIFFSSVRNRGMRIDNRLSLIFSKFKITLAVGVHIAQLIETAFSAQLRLKI